MSLFRIKPPQGTDHPQNWHAFCCYSGMKTDGPYSGIPATALVCSCDPALREGLARLLRELGCSRTILCGNAADALRRAYEELPGAVLLIHDPPVLDAVALCATLHKKVKTPVLAGAASWSPALAKAAVAAGIAAFLTIRPSAAELNNALLGAMFRHDRDDELRCQVQELEQRLADRKLVERAKGLLMQREGLTEELAFSSMRKQAMTRRISMARLALELIDELPR